MPSFIVRGSRGSEPFLHGHLTTERYHALLALDIWVKIVNSSAFGVIFITDSKACPQQISDLKERWGLDNDASSNMSKRHVERERLCRLPEVIAEAKRRDMTPWALTDRICPAFDEEEELEEERYQGEEQIFEIEI